VISFLKFFFRLPYLLFKLAGLIRITSRAKALFRKTLLEEGLPREVADELVEEFAPNIVRMLR